MTTRRIELPNGNVEYRNEFGELHNPEGWAKIEGENPRNKSSYLNGQLHSVGDKPAVIRHGRETYGGLVFHNYGWYHHGKIHRDGDKPDQTVIATRKKKPHIIRFYKGDTLHNEERKPAVIDFVKSGKKLSYYRNGEKYTPGKPVKGANKSAKGAAK